MDRVPAIQDEAVTATNLTNANSTSRQDEEARSVGLRRCPWSPSLTNYLSSLGLQPVSAARQEEESQSEGAEPLDLASNCIASLSIRQRGREEARRLDEEQQLRPAKRLCLDAAARFKLPKTYFCGYCDRSFHSVAYYCRHLRRHVDLWRCDKCNQGFELFALKKHHRKLCVKLMRHRNQRKYCG